MSGDWIIQRQLHSGAWDTYAEGYAMAGNAKLAAVRAGKSQNHVSRWRVVYEGAGQAVIYETIFRPGVRAKWEPVLEPA